MGCWNGTCGLTNLHIKHGDEVMVFAMVKNRKVDSLCYTTPFYSPLLMPFYAKYNDYGGGEDCSGIGLKPVIEAIKSNLVELPVGANQYHDIAVKKDKFDDELFFEACHERRLFVTGYRAERLHVEFVMFRKDVVDHIIENRVMEKYVGDGKGTHGWGNNYVHYKFADIIADLPAAMEFLDTIITDEDSIFAMYNPLDQLRKMEDNNFAAMWLSGGDYRYSRLIRFDEHIIHLLKKKEMEKLIDYLTEHLKAKFIDSFMMDTRKFWSPQAGAGSQQQEHSPYRLLTAAMTHALDIEKKEWEAENEGEFE